ncbi:MAG: hypothetical protein IPK06_01230 [Ignavibacteriae bacterium]|nr:hypothetical protein [Ignavibacteriota bacterium]
MEILSITLSSVIVVLIIYLIYSEIKNSIRIEKVLKENKKFLESIEKYVEIFNEHNVKNLLSDGIAEDSEAQATIISIKDEFKNKLLKKNSKFTEEHEILIDFVILNLSLLIRIPPSLRKKLIDQSTENEEIKEILISKLNTIEKHYAPVSILDIAISES